MGSGTGNFAAALDVYGIWAMLESWERGLVGVEGGTGGAEAEGVTGGAEAEGVTGGAEVVGIGHAVAVAGFLAGSHVLQVRLTDIRVLKRRE